MLGKEKFKEMVLNTFGDDVSSERLDMLYKNYLSTELCVAIPTEPQDIKILEFNQFIRKINDPEQIVYARVYLEIKKQFLASLKFNNAKNKINLTNKHLYKSYKESLAITIQFFNELKKQERNQKND